MSLIFIYLFWAIFTIIIKVYLFSFDYLPDFILISFFIFCYSNIKKKSFNLTINVLAGLLAGFIVDILSLSMFGTFMICYGLLGILVTFTIKAGGTKTYLTNTVIVFILSIVFYCIYMLVSYIVYDFFPLNKFFVIITVSVMNAIGFVLFKPKN